MLPIDAAETAPPAPLFRGKLDRADFITAVGVGKARSAALPYGPAANVPYNIHASVIHYSSNKE
jgi:hypothetical protein